MKNKSSIFLSLTLSLALILTNVFTAFAITNPIVYADDISVKAGNTIKIPVRISNNTGLAGVKLSFNYDDTKLIPMSVEAGNVFTGGLQDNIEGDAQAGSFNVYWASSTGENVTSNGILFYINFKVDDSAYGTTSINILYGKDDTFDEDFNDVILNCKNIDVQISNDSVANKIKVTTKAERDSVSIVDLKFRISNVSRESEITYIINYDNSTFFYSNLFGKANIVSNNAGVLTINTQTNVDDNNTDYITVRFAIKGGSLSGTYPFDVTTDDENIICESCNITISNLGSAETAKVFIPTGLIAEKGKSISVPVMINNNQGIMGYRLRFTYNTDDLQIVSVTNDEDFGGNLYDSIGNKDGVFDVVWNSTENKTLNGTILYLNFNVVSKTTNKAITSPIAISYVSDDTFDENYNDVILNCIEGSLRICPSHTYISAVVEPSCETNGYKYYRCQYCTITYREDFTQSLGHYYIYQKDPSSAIIKSFNMTYKCNDCNDVYNTNGDNVLHIWNNNTNTYINSIPSRNDLYSQLLDVNHDEFINAKDFAMIIHAQKTKQGENI